MLKWPILFSFFQIILIVLLKINYIKSGYHIDFNEFLISKQIYLSLILAIIFIPLLYKDYKKYIVKNKKVNYILMILIGILLSLSYNVIGFNLDKILKTNLYSYNSHILTNLICSGIIGPIIEELMFRGIMFNKIKHKKVFITSLIFALFHLNIIQMIYAFLLSYILIFFYKKYNTLKAPITIHMASNITTTLFLNILINNNYNLHILLISVFILIILKKFTKIFDM